eukprot:superscaffoldBa00003034_g15939
MTEWSRKPAVCNSVSLFSKTFTQIFQQTAPGQEAARALVRLQQELDSLIALAIKINKCLYERERGRTRPCSSLPFQQRQQASSSSSSSWRRTPPADSTTAPPPATEEPMQLGRTHLTPKERQRRVSEGCCIYCGQLGHFIAFLLKDRAHKKLGLKTFATWMPAPWTTGYYVRSPIALNHCTCLFLTLTPKESAFMSLELLSTHLSWDTPGSHSTAPHIDWKTGQNSPSLDPEFPDLSRIPVCYHDLKEVFSNAHATSLSPHQAYDCAIDLLPGTSPPKGRLYSLSAPETQAMKNLSSGHHPQTNGQTEKLNQELKISLRCPASQSPNTWSRQLTWVEYAHSSLYCPSSGLSPFQCAYGYQSPLFPALEKEKAAAADPRPHVQEWSEGMAIHLRPAFQSGIPEIRSQVRWAIPHFQSHCHTPAG